MSARVGETVPWPGEREVVGISGEAEVEGGAEAGQAGWSSLNPAARLARGGGGRSALRKVGGRKLTPQPEVCLDEPGLTRPGNCGFPDLRRDGVRCTAPSACARPLCRIAEARGEDASDTRPAEIEAKLSRRSSLEDDAVRMCSAAWVLR